ncbi:malonyl-CoA-acyl carrier protein transacylase [Pitangus sulphuratus]|nr:malonyl-CoA-acyl carrier protein transacylase [Pitangus sulphuratus]
MERFQWLGPQSMGSTEIPVIKPDQNSEGKTESMEGLIKHGGIRKALEYLQQNARKYYFTRTKMLPVSGAFHTRLMEPAVEPLAEVLKSIEIQKPLLCVYSNVDGKKYMHSKHIRKLLVKQVVSPVLWEQTMHSVYERKQGTEFPYTYEVGPGNQLGAILRKCNLKAWKQYRHVDALEDEEAAEI